jgi:outer membrane protein insertion porin family
MRTLRTIILALLCLVSVPAFATRVADIEFEGLILVPEERALSLMESQEGEEYSSQMVSRDLKVLYRSGLFSNVTVKKRRVSGGIKIIVQVVENQVIKDLKFTGNKKLKDDDLHDVITVREYQVLDKARVTESVREITKKYEDKGYYLADVEVSALPDEAEPGKVNLNFKIQENKKVKIRRINFIGNRSFRDKKLRKSIRTKEKGFFSFLSGSGTIKEGGLFIDQQLLKLHYLDHGYLRVNVEEPRITLTRNKKSIYITFPLTEGDVYSVRSVDVAGDILTTRDELVSLFSLKPDETYSKTKEIEDLQALERAYGDQAYAFANFIPDLNIDDENHTVGITYYIQKGPKVKIDEIIVKGNDVTRDKVVRRELQFVENSFYSKSAIEESKARLMRTGFFENVNISTPRSDENDKVNVVIEVTERKNTGTFSINAGFSTLESFVFGGSISKENFFGLGINGSLNAQISKLRQDFLINMNDPYFLDTKWQVGVTLQRVRSRLNPAFQENRVGGSITFGREIFDYFTASVGYRIEDVSASRFSSQVPAFFSQNASGLTSAVLANLVYDRRDNRIFTSKGFYTGVHMEYSDGVLGASNQYFRILSDSRVFFKMPASTILKARTQVGYAKTLGPQPIRLFERYFLGGPNTLRGFDFRSVGPNIDVPTIPTGGDTRFTFGGNKMVMVNVEYEIPVVKKAGVNAVVFFDAGNAYSEAENIDPLDLRMNYGVGLRWQSPFGALRFEWGFPINKRSGDPSTVFNFTIGNSF